MCSPAPMRKNVRVSASSGPTEPLADALRREGRRVRFRRGQALFIEGDFADRGFHLAVLS